MIFTLAAAYPNLHYFCKSNSGKDRGSVCCSYYFIHTAASARCQSKLRHLEPFERFPLGVILAHAKPLKRLEKPVMLYHRAKASV